MLPDCGISKKINVGLALLEKKHHTFVKDSLVKMAREKGIHLVVIDRNRPLSEQGPFDIILHKIPSNPRWNQEILSLSESCPDVVVIDRPDAIEKLNNRITMLEVVENLQITEYSGYDKDDDNAIDKNEDEKHESEGDGDDKEIPIVGIPKQCVMLREDEESPEILSKVRGLCFPIIAKPLVADGTTDAHAMSVAFNPESLSKVKPPVVLQEFINHGGVIFKVYVVGEYSQCVCRRSLPDIVLEDQKDGGRELLSFCQISNTSSESYPSDPDVKQVKFPPHNFISSLVSNLRKRLGLNLFNFDIIRESKTRNRYYIIDINYFPGYAKMPDYERVLTDFFISVAKK